MSHVGLRSHSVNSTNFSHRPPSLCFHCPIAPCDNLISLLAVVISDHRSFGTTSTDLAYMYDTFSHGCQVVGGSSQCNNKNVWTSTSTRRSHGPERGWWVKVEASPPLPVQVRLVHSNSQCTPWHMFLAYVGSLSAPGARIFFDPCPTGDLLGGALSAVRARCNYLHV